MRSIFPLLFLFHFGFTIAQPEPDLERIFNVNTLTQEEQFFAEELNTLLLDLFSDPINLNTVSEELLNSLPFLSFDQIQNLIEYRRNYGPLISKWELQSIDGWDFETCRLIEGFLTVTTKEKGPRFKDFLSNSEILIRQSRITQEKKGFRDSIGWSHFRNKWQLRAKSSAPGKYSTAIAMENDPGEMYKINNEQFLFDHISGNFSLYNLGILKVVTIGDYRLQFGQGIIHGGSFGGRKSSEAIISIRKSNRGIMPSAGFGEFGYKRGVAMTINKKGVSITPYISFLPQDANLNYDSLQNHFYFSSFSYSGLHRNQNEFNSRNSVKTLEAGGIIMAKSISSSYGIQANFGEYSAWIQHNSEPYQALRFSGRTYNSQGIFFEKSIANFFFFHETVLSNFNAIGSITGTIVSISKGLDLSMLYRYYSPKFYSPSGQSFSENSTANNESGLYFGLKYQAFRKILFSGYFDYFKFPWLKYLTFAPTNGYEYSIRVDFLNKETPFYFLIRSENKPYASKIGSEALNDLKSNRTNITIDCRFTLTEKISTEIRPSATFANINGNKSSGYLLKQDIKFETRSFNCTAGVFLFDAPSFDSRLYAREQDVRYQSTFPLFYGKGVRYFALAKIKIKRNFNFWLKYYLTSYSDRDEISSGDDLIQGNKISEIKTQITYSFK